MPVNEIDDWLKWTSHKRLWRYSKLFKKQFQAHTKKKQTSGVKNFDILCWMIGFFSMVVIDGRSLEINFLLFT